MSGLIVKEEEEVSEYNEVEGPAYWFGEHLKEERNLIAEVYETHVCDYVGYSLRGVAEDKDTDKCPHGKDNALVKLGELTILYVSLLVDECPES